MQKFMCTHTLPPGAISPEQINQMSDAAQHDPVVRGYRSFFNLSEGKVLCVIEAPDAQALAKWFGKMNLPYDSITPVEYEGDRGEIRETRERAQAGQQRKAA